MSTLPASVRLSLWVTAAWAGHVDLEEAVRRALPDIDHLTGDTEYLRTWQDFGERVLACALPRSGDLTGMPRGNPDLMAAATEAGECVFVPALGGALVPTVEIFGPEGDEGTAVRLTAFDCAPTPAHQLEALHESQIERELRGRLARSTEALEQLDVQPFVGSPLRATADDVVALREWGLPPGLPGRAIRVLQTAGTVGAAVDFALTHSHAVDAASDAGRQRALLDLQAAADTAMAQATTAAALNLAGMRAGD
ncbi:hypothetical protein HJ588_17575 [Flexivirga sp. ID2601S]|uniref:Uncharacterized protein n=1 Tax=Flexivirga aerilata TaxID=1656889 RepID=A0A849AWM6_9MICO|nr:hypothetical protein [Flexivirga aerilata]NNG41072.1 hypothetical protein [Flexivirga aerilata]